ncbi:MAG: hypothetical protein CMN30_03360 [Sandaracinus sp.]|nr:hypothetical protein [Sandaracinus sp.]
MLGAMVRLPLFVALLLAFTACDRGPQPPAEDEAAETAEAPEVPTHDPSEAHAQRQPPAVHGAGGPGAAPSHGGAPVVDPRAPQLAGIKWTVEEPLTYRAPSRPMRNAEYVVDEGATEAVLTVFHFPGMGGSIDENISRWTAQFKTADGAPVTDADTQTRTVGGLQVTTVDVTGTFASSMGMGGGEPQADSRLLGAIVDGPEGPIFFKLLGPADTVGTAEAAFGALVDSIEPVG